MIEGIVITEETKAKLKELMQSGFEHSGCIDATGKIAMVGQGKEHEATKLPTDVRIGSLKDMVKLAKDCCLIFHTHPGTLSIPSMNDVLSAYHTLFLERNLIVGSDGIIEVRIDDELLFQYLSDRVVEYYCVKITDGKFDTRGDIDKYDAGLNKIIGGMAEPEEMGNFAGWVEERIANQVGQVFRDASNPVFLLRWYEELKKMGVVLNRIEKWS